MKEFLSGLLPRLLPEDITYHLIPHNGKSDLEKSIPRKLRGWREPGVRFVIVRDKDAEDCHLLKRRLVEMCENAGRADTLVRIACYELESWYLADLAAVDSAFGTSVARHQEKRLYRSPDTTASPSRELKSLVPAFQKVGGARKLGVLVDLENARSGSFSCFVNGVLRLVSPT